MQQSVGMGIHKAPRRLDRDIQDPLLHFPRSPAVEGLVPDPVLDWSRIRSFRLPPSIHSEKTDGTPLISLT